MSNYLKKHIKTVFLGILMAIVLFLVPSYILSMILGFTVFFFTQEGLALSMLSLKGLTVWLFYIPVEIPIRLNIGIIFLFLCSVYAICFIVAWRLRESLQGVLEKLFHAR